MASIKCTVFISNLPFSLKDDDIRKLSQSYGKIVKITVLKDKTTGDSLGKAFVSFSKAQDAAYCTIHLNNKQVGGRTIRSTIAIDKQRKTKSMQKEHPSDSSANMSSQSSLSSKEKSIKTKKKTRRNSKQPRYINVDDIDEYCQDNDT